MPAIKNAAGFAKKRDPGMPVVLLYGPDQGLVRERAGLIGAQVVPDADDPWAIADLAESDLGEAGRLADEVQALSFGATDRLVRVRGGGASVLAAAKLLLGGLDDGMIKPAAVTVIEAGDLKKTSALVKACTASRHCAVLACYAENERDVAASVREAVAAAGLTIEDEALAVFAGRLGDDRGITRSETDKLILYKGQHDGPITRADIDACLADGTADATFEVWERAASGDVAGLSDALHRAEGAGANLMGILRISQGKLMRLLKAATLVEQGQPPSAAMKALRPPVFYGEQQSFSDQLKRWKPRHLEAAVADLLAADLAAKTTGAPQREIIERAMLRIASRARR